jgi:hypothetical protein
MKTAYLAIALLGVPVSARAAEIDPAAVQLWDVVHTADGSVLKGVIVEEIPGASVRVVLVGGSAIVVPMANVVRFARELNPAFAHQPSAPVAERPTPPALAATSGLRIGVMPGVAFHTEGESTFLLNARIGWEIGLGRWGLIPGVVADLTPDVGTYGAAGGGATAAVRAAYRGSTLSPFVGFGIGADIVSDDVSLATFMSAGVDLLVHRRFALTAEAKFHRGFGDTYIQALSYAAIGMGVEVRL